MARSRFSLIVAVVGVFVVLSASARAQPGQVAGTLVLAMPATEFHRFAVDHPGAYGLGVFPDSRDPLRFVTEIGVGAPAGEEGERSPLAGAPGSLGRALERAGVGVEFRSGGPAPIEAALGRAFSGAGEVTYRPPLRVAAVSTTFDAEQILRSEPGAVIVLGIGTTTPVLIELCDAPCANNGKPAVVENGIARRPAIVTPYDLARTIYDRLARPRKPVLTAGNDLRTESDPRALRRIGAIAASLDRDAKVGHAVGGVTVPMSIAAAFLGVGLVWFGRNRWAIRAGLASWAANVGYIISLFVPTGNGGVRVLIMLGVMAAAAALPVRGSPRRAAGYAFAITAVFWAAALVAPLRPGGFPATAIWGNPLISWRFFGLQNFEAGLLASGVVVWGVIAGLGPRALTVAAIAAGVVIAAPTIGANYVGVLTFAFGVVLAIAALVRRKIETWHVIAAGVIAVAAFIVSLLADSGSPVSHGGRAARRISQGGVSVLWDFVHERLRLNIDLIRSWPAGLGYICLALLVGAMVALFRYALKDAEPRIGRIAAWAGCAMALSSLVLEDSGFYSGGVIFVIAAAGYVVVSGGAASGELPAAETV